MLADIVSYRIRCDRRLIPRVFDKTWSKSLKKSQTMWLLHFYWDYCYDCPMILYFLRRPPAKTYPRQIADIVTEPLILDRIPYIRNSLCFKQSQYYIYILPIIRTTAVVQVLLELIKTPSDGSNKCLLGQNDWRIALGTNTRNVLCFLLYHVHVYNSECIPL